ncbi:hypothetical protein V8D89_007263 [Ganoderma adspersum]
MTGRYPYYPSTHNHDVAQGNPQNAGDHPTQPWTSYPSPASSIHTPILVELSQHRYGHVVHDGHVVEFNTLNGFPINLHQAFTKDLDDLVNKNEPAFSPDMNVRAKASIRIQIQSIRTYTRQFMSLRSNREATSISREKLAHTIAKEVHKMMRGDVLRVPGFGEFRMEDIHLTKLGVHLALQMASTCGAQWPPAQGRQVVAMRRRRNTDRMMIMNQQRLARSIFAGHWPCANMKSPFGSWGREYRLGGRRRRRGVGRPSETRRGIELSWFPSFFSVLYYASGYFFSGSGVTLTQCTQIVHDPVVHKHPISLPGCLGLFTHSSSTGVGPGLLWHVSNHGYGLNAVAFQGDCVQCQRPTWMYRRRRL